MYIIYDNSMSDEDISSQIRRRRMETGLSISELAHRVNTSPATISRYENGWRRFEVYTLRKIAGALGCRLTITFRPAHRPPSIPGKASCGDRLQRLFWDHPLSKREINRHPVWVVERVLEYGNLDDLQSLMETFGRRRFLELAAQARFASAKTKNFWKQMLAREKIICTTKFSREEASAFWQG